MERRRKFGLKSLLSSVAVVAGIANEFGLFEIQWGGPLSLLKKLQHRVGHVRRRVVVAIPAPFTLVTNHCSALLLHAEVTGAAKYRCSELGHFDQLDDSLLLLAPCKILAEISSLIIQVKKQNIRTTSLPFTCTHKRL